MEDREEVPGDRKHPWPTRARKKTECLLTSTSQKHEGKAATKLSPKLQKLGHSNRCEQIHHAPDVEGQSGGQALQNATSPGAYCQLCGHEGPKMQENPPGDGRRYTAEPRVRKRRN